MTAGRMLCELVNVRGHAGDLIPAYVARPLGRPSFGAVVVIHYAPGWDATIHETTRRIAAGGYLAVCPNLHHREQPGGDPHVQAELVRAAGRVPDERFVGDFAGTLDWIPTVDGWNGRVGVMGFCSGGRQALLAGCEFALDAIVDCYGGRVVVPPDGLYERQPTAVFDMLGRLSAPVLGLFGGADDEPSPFQVAQIADELRRLGKVFHFEQFDGVGHGFFSVDRPSYDVDAVRTGWQLTFDWFERHLDDPTQR